MTRLRARTAFPIAGAGALAAILFAVVGPAPATAAGSDATSRMAAFAAAAHEFLVPLDVLLATSYNETRWEGHDGKPSFAAGYGPMNLTDLTQADLTAGGWGGDAERRNDLLTAPSLHTLPAAAALTGTDVSTVETDSTQNIRAGAALLASYEKTYDHGRLPTDAAGWYVAVARYSESSETIEAQVFADDVYATIRTGQNATTQDGQTITETPDPGVRPDRGGLARLQLTGNHPPANPTQDPSQLPGDTAECPASLHCDYHPSGYWQFDPSSLGDYGDHDIADKGNISQGADLQIRYITLHDNEETADGTEWLFHDPSYEASANYEVRSDGEVTQMVPVEDIAWDSANQSFYQHSVAIEQEGYAIDGATWYSEAMYHSTATLVRYLAATYDIPLDRAHILGHDNIPGSSNTRIATQHWDPGPYWDWGHFMALLGAPIHATAVAGSDVVTIDPQFATNKQVVTGCQNIQDLTPYPGPYHGDETCTNATAVAQPSQGTSFVWLHTGPSDASPLFADQYLHADGSAGTIRANDWGDKASAGQQYVVAARQGDWTAIWYSGQQAWFKNPGGAARTAVPAAARYVITPKAGLASIPVYTTTYPETSVYPPDLVSWYGGYPHTQTAVSKYQILAGQEYVAGGPAAGSDWFEAFNIDGSAPYDRTDFVGSTRYYEITYNHRQAFVNAADVDVVAK